MGNEISPSVLDSVSFRAVKKHGLAPKGLKRNCSTAFLSTPRSFKKTAWTKMFWKSNCFQDCTEKKPKVYLGAYKIRADYKRKTDGRRTACRAVPTVADKNGERLAVPLRKKERKKGGWSLWLVIAPLFIKSIHNCPCWFNQNTAYVDALLV